MLKNIRLIRLILVLFAVALLGACGTVAEKARNFDPAAALSGLGQAAGSVVNHGEKPGQSTIAETAIQEAFIKADAGNTPMEGGLGGIGVTVKKPFKVSNFECAHYTLVHSGVIEEGTACRHGSEWLGYTWTKKAKEWLMQRLAADGQCDIVRGTPPRQVCLAGDIIISK